MKKNSKIIIAIIIVSPIFWIFQDLITFNDSKIIENSESEEYTDIIGLFDRKDFQTIHIQNGLIKIIQITILIKKP